MLIRKPKRVIINPMIRQSESVDTRVNFDAKLNRGKYAIIILRFDKAVFCLVN